MKKQKRDLKERAYQRGYRAGLEGRHQELCPHVLSSMRDQWLSGWREGRLDNWNGFNMASGMQKLAMR
ncbi:MAG: ribosome modulation factor [Verrucomicrobiaceae bacterium]|nr:ribosome modulation factor [Verrucomicrobiaceae bacterium]